MRHRCQSASKKSCSSNSSKAARAVALLVQSLRAVRTLAGLSPVSSHGPLKVSLLVDAVVPGSTAIRNGTVRVNFGG